MLVAPEPVTEPEWPVMVVAVAVQEKVVPGTLLVKLILVVPPEQKLCVVTLGVTTGNGCTTMVIVVFKAH